MTNLPTYPNNTQNKWKGMTLREMQMRRVLVQTRMEIEKYRISTAFEQVKQSTPFFGGSGTSSRFGSIITFAKYAIFAVKITRQLKSMFRKR